MSSRIAQAEAGRFASSGIALACGRIRPAANLSFRRKPGDVGHAGFFHRPKCAAIGVAAMDGLSANGVVQYIGLLERRGSESPLPVPERLASLWLRLPSHPGLYEIMMKSSGNWPQLPRGKHGVGS